MLKYVFFYIRHILTTTCEKFMESKKNLLVVQSNKLIEAHYKQEYTVQEQRTVLWMIGEIHKEDFVYHEKNILKEIKISAVEYAKLMDIPVQHVYRDAKKIGKSLMNKVLAIENPASNSWLLVHWVSSMKYEKGIISLTIHPELIPYLIDLKEKFTSFKLENILYLNSSHAIKLYQLLAQYRTIGERQIMLDDLRSVLGIEEKKIYRLYGDIKRKILDISKREINAKTDITFSYKPIKPSRKVIGIEFKITPKQKEGTISVDKKIELQREAKKCFHSCNGTCGALWETHKTNVEHSCHHCQKFTQAKA